MITTTEQLKDRIEARRYSLQARMAQLKADTRKEAAETRDQIKRKLDELETMIGDGWDNVTEVVQDRLNRWLDRN